MPRRSPRGKPYHKPKPRDPNAPPPREHGERSTAAGEHRPSMLAEVLAALDPQPGHIVVDCTLGFAGHAVELLKRVGPTGCSSPPTSTPRTCRGPSEARRGRRAVRAAPRATSPGCRACSRPRASPASTACSPTSACRACRWTTATAGSRSCATARSTCGWTPPAADRRRAARHAAGRRTRRVLPRPRRRAAGGGDRRGDRRRRQTKPIRADEGTARADRAGGPGAVLRGPGAAAGAEAAARAGDAGVPGAAHPGQPRTGEPEATAARAAGRC